MNEQQDTVGRSTRPKMSRKTKAAAAVALAGAVALSSTFAWTSYNQMATNEFATPVNAGGRLHDDFIFTSDEQNKDIYVENFTDSEDGMPIFARVMLLEYLEVGQDAGAAETDEKIVNARYPESGSKDDPLTWDVHVPGDTDLIHHNHFTWTEGGQTIFMPTFNKNRDSLAAEINGSYDDEDGPYSGYTVYTDGQKLEGEALYDADDNTEDEGTSSVVDVNHTAKTEEHTAKATGTATIMTMEEWIENGSVPGPYWVYDDDGWAYWAQAIMPGEATGLLLDKVETKAPISDTWFYGVHAIGEFVSLEEWHAASVPHGESARTAYFMDQARTNEISVNAFSLLCAAGDALMQPGEEEPAA